MGSPVSRLPKLLLAAALVLAACGVPSGHPHQTVLLRATGMGTQTTQSFTASGPWSIAWSFHCDSGSGGSLFIDVFNASDHTPDFKNRGIAAEGEQSGADTSHFANPGSFYLEITSTCAWTINVYE